MFREAGGETKEVLARAPETLPLHPKPHCLLKGQGVR